MRRRRERPCVTISSKLSKMSCCQRKKSRQPATTRGGRSTPWSICHLINLKFRRGNMIKRVEVNYRGIFQKNLGKKIGSDIVMIASRMGQTAFSNGRYSDAPERNGIPCKYFAFVSPDLAEEELEAECGA